MNRNGKFLVLKWDPGAGGVSKCRKWAYSLWWPVFIYLCPHLFPLNHCCKL